jgi:hypothetical protein
MSKILFVLSVVVLLVWVIPNMIEYYSNVKSYETKETQLKSMALSQGIQEDAKLFDKAQFLEETKKVFETVSVEPLEDGTYEVSIVVNTAEMDKFHKFLKAISLRYKVRVDNNLMYETEADKTLKAKFTLRTL